jgi:hypothetical protein
MDPLLQRALEIANRQHQPQQPGHQSPGDNMNESITIEPAAPNARPVYWERADGSISGPARPEFLAQVGTGPAASFWVVTTYEGQARWIRSDRLRSKRQFESQAKTRIVEPLPRSL